MGAAFRSDETAAWAWRAYGWVVRARYVVRITPADVGARVTVRSVVAGGTTDAVGVLESWAGGVLRVRRRDGSVAEVAEGAMVAARVIPAPPPSRSL